LLVLLLTTAVQAQPLVYHCDYDTRLAATKQIADTPVSEDGNYSYTLFGGNPLVWSLSTNPIIEW